MGRLVVISLLVLVITVTCFSWSVSSVSLSHRLARVGLARGSHTLSASVGLDVHNLLTPREFQLVAGIYHKHIILKKPLAGKLDEKLWAQYNGLSKEEQAEVQLAAQAPQVNDKKGSVDIYKDAACALTGREKDKFDTAVKLGQDVARNMDNLAFKNSRICSTANTLYDNGVLSKDAKDLNVDGFFKGVTDFCTDCTNWFKNKKL